MDDGPPIFMRLAAEPVRWRLLTALAESDRRVRELSELVSAPPNLVSYHLGRLRTAGLVRARRSSADGRDSYYHLDLERCRALHAAAGAALHPRLGGGIASRRSRRPVRVLFLCTGNSARSQMAQALLERAGGNGVRVASAGSRPKPISPAAVRVMREYGLDLSGRRSTHLDALAGRRFDYVLTLCDRVREVCPDFPGPARLMHWSIPDPAADPRATLAPFRAVAADLEARIGFLLPVLGVVPRELAR